MLRSWRKLGGDGGGEGFCSGGGAPCEEDVGKGVDGKWRIVLSSRPAVPGRIDQFSRRTGREVCLENGDLMGR